MIGAFPLGGYVQDARRARGRRWPPEERHLAFNTQPLRLARRHRRGRARSPTCCWPSLLYAAVNWIGVQEPQAGAGQPGRRLDRRAGRPARRRAGRAAPASTATRCAPVRSFEDLRWLLTRGALDGRDVRLVRGRRRAGAAARGAAAAWRSSTRSDADAQLFRKVGILGPWTHAGDRRGGGRRRRRNAPACARATWCCASAASRSSTASSCASRSARRCRAASALHAALARRPRRRSCSSCRSRPTS